MFISTSLPSSPPSPSINLLPSRKKPIYQRLDSMADDSRPQSRSSSGQSSQVTLSLPAQALGLESKDFNEKDVAPTPTALSISTGSESSLPRERQPLKWYQRVWFHWFTAYRILLGLTVAINLAVIIAWLVNHFRADAGVDRDLSGLLTASATHIFLAVLIRQEDFINWEFKILSKIPSTLPFWFRKTISDFHHFGGLHIGAAISSFLWFLVFVGLNTDRLVRLVKPSNTSAWQVVDLVTSYAFLSFIGFMCVTAHPKLRVRFHNTFEHTHRFGGWAALLVLWINTGTSVRVHHDNPPLYESPALWLLAGATFLIILPWLRMYRVPIRAEKVSAREVRVTFPYAKMAYTSTQRFSLTPLMEWHAFATIPSPDGFTASIIISQAGDWTKNMIENPPERIWLRNPPTMNFLSLSPLFNSLLLVGTGAGIGPLLSLLSSPLIAKMKAQGRPIRVIWVVYNPDAPHWKFVQDIIRAVDPEPHIFDSRKSRPDVAFEAQYYKQKYNLEAVMVVSNPKVTFETVREVKSKGGAAYGAVFDS